MDQLDKAIAEEVRTTMGALIGRLQNLQDNDECSEDNYGRLDKAIDHLMDAQDVLSKLT